DWSMTTTMLQLMLSLRPSGGPYGMREGCHQRHGESRYDGVLMATRNLIVTADDVGLDRGMTEGAIPSRCARIAPSVMPRSRSTSSAVTIRFRVAMRT